MPEEAHVEYLADMPTDQGKFLIRRVHSWTSKSDVVGVTGYFEHGNQIGLAWHGILPQYRGRGYGRIAFNYLVAIIKLNYPNNPDIVEFVPADREDEVGPFFKNLGFVKTGKLIDPNDMDSTDTDWFEYVYTLT